MRDCAFVSLPKPFQPGWHDEDAVILPEFGRAGFFTFQQWWDGQCYRYDNESFGDATEQRQYYFEILGSDWESGRILAPVVAGLGLLTLMYSLSYCCSVQWRSIRYTFGIWLSVVMTISQSMTFKVFGSDFCAENQCSMGRSAGFSIIAVLCYFAAGVCFFLSWDSPGRGLDEKSDLEESIGEDEELGRHPTEFVPKRAPESAKVAKTPSSSDDEENAPTHQGSYQPVFPRKEENARAKQIINPDEIAVDDLPDGRTGVHFMASFKESAQTKMMTGDNVSLESEEDEEDNSSQPKTGEETLAMDVGDDFAAEVVDEDILVADDEELREADVERAGQPGSLAHIRDPVKTKMIRKRIEEKDAESEEVDGEIQAGSFGKDKASKFEVSVINGGEDFLAMAVRKPGMTTPMILMIKV